jgi:hypothetical protein
MQASLPEYSFENAFSRGWQSLKASYGLVLGAAMTLVGIGIAFAVAGMIFEEALGFDPISIAETFFVSPMLNAGMILLTAMLARGHSPPYAALFHGFSRYWMVFLINLVVLACIAGLGLVLLPGLLAMMAGSDDLGTVLLFIGAICFLPAAIFLHTRIGFAVVIAVDPGTNCQGVSEALRQSWRMTEKHWLSLIGLYIVLGLIAIASALLLVLPLFFFGIPLLMTVTGAAYAQLANRLGGGVCTRCGYDLRGSPGARCPECGHWPDAGPMPAPR